METMELETITGQIGAIAHDIDLTQMTDSQFADVEQAFAEQLVLSFPNQALTPQSLLDLTERFGGPGDTPYLTGLSEFPDVVPVVKEADEQSPHTFGAGWHTDFTFQKRPPSRTLLYAVDTPPTGGDTLYCNLYSAYETLSPTLQESLRQLQAVHSAVRSYGPQATLKDHMENMTIVNDEHEPERECHPVVRRHPVTEKAALWVNPVYTIGIQGMSDEESAPLLKQLNDHAVSPTFCCRVAWSPGMLTMWDNRCTQHCATSDYTGHRREMWRTTVQGEVPLPY